MFTSTPPRNNCNAVCTNEENLLVPASAATASSVGASSMQRKRGRSDIMSTAMVSPFVMDQRYDYNANNSTSSSPMTNDTATTRLEPLIESTDNTDNNQQQQQQSMPLSQVSTTSISTTNNSASSSADPTPSSFHNNGTKLIYTTELQPPMKRVKVNNCSDVGGQYDNDVIPPLEEHKDDEKEEMACQRPCKKGSSAAKAASTAATTTETLLSKFIGSSGNSSNIVDVSSATMSKLKDVAASPKNSQSSCCCHVCGGTGGDTAVDDVMLTQCSEDIIGSGSNNSGGSNCASRSIASYFQVTKKHSSMKPDPISSLSCSSRKVTSSLSPSSSSQQHKVLQSTNTPHLPPCRYCDRPTCRNNPSCIKQCEECQHNFCSFCCKVNYMGVYEKTVCFECDELIMLSHCCDRMELG